MRRLHEVARVCSQLKPGVCGVLIDYEHVKFAAHDLWILLQDMYQEYFESCMVPESLKSGIILSMFKGKGAKANNKDNYRGITLFPTLCKIYEMILLIRLDNFAAHKGFFSEMQFGFQEGGGGLHLSKQRRKTSNWSIFAGKPPLIDQ